MDKLIDFGPPEDRANDAPEDECGAIDRAEEHFEEGQSLRTEIDEAAAAEYFGEPSEAEGHPAAAGHTIDCCGDTCSRECTCGTCPPMPTDQESMTPDPKPDSYYAGGLSMAPPPATLMLEKLRVGLSIYVSPAVLSQMKFDQKYDPVTDKIMMELGMYLFSNKIHTETTKEEIPMTWWDGFKDAHFPGFLSRRFPSRFRQVFKEIKTIHICPHLNYHTRNDEKFHLQFLMPEGDLTRYGA